MSGAGGVPEGFVASGRGGRSLVADARWVEQLRREGLDGPEGWQRHLARPAGPAGRGAAARVELGPGRVARLKRLRRGGWAAPLWRDRFVGRRRAIANLRLPLEAARREVPTPAPVALLIDPCGPGLVRAWLAVEEVESAVDLCSRLASGRPPTPTELGACLRLVRAMHDRGVSHPDLNLGNLLVREGPEPEAWVIDLDRATLHAGPLGFGPRQEALRRLERSYVKACHPSPPSVAVRDSIYADYAQDDRDLAAGLARGRGMGRFWIAVHRLAWPR